MASHGSKVGDQVRMKGQPESPSMTVSSVINRPVGTPFAIQVGVSWFTTGGVQQTYVDAGSLELVESARD